MRPKEHIYILSHAWELLESKRIITVATGSHFDNLDPKFKRFSNHRVYCIEQPGGGGKFRPYRIPVGFDSDEVETESLDFDIYFLDKSEDPLYRYIESIKSAIIDEATLRAEEIFGGDDEGADAGPDLRLLAKEVLDDPQPYLSVNGQTGNEYIEKMPVRIEFGPKHTMHRR